MRGYDGRADIDPDPSALSLRLQHYLREVYNHKPHESLNGLTPYERFRADERPLRMHESDEELRSRFVLHIKRTVSADQHARETERLYDKEIDCQYPYTEALVGVGGLVNPCCHIGAGGIMPSRA